MRTRTKRRLRREIALRAGAQPGDWHDSGCAYCGVLIIIVWEEAEPEFVMACEFGLPTNERAHVDHVIPECRNGSTSLDNSVLACPTCNLAKGAVAFGEPGFLRWLQERRRAVIAAADAREERIARIRAQNEEARF